MLGEGQFGLKGFVGLDGLLKGLLDNVKKLLTLRLRRLRRLRRLDDRF